MQNTARANQGSTLPFNKYRNFTIFSNSVNATNFVVRFILWEPKIYCNIYFQSIKFGGSTNGCCFLFLVFFIAYSGDQNLYPTNKHTHAPENLPIPAIAFFIITLDSQSSGCIFQSWGPFLKKYDEGPKIWLAI